ncbi:MBL fold metallo-hydrolase [Streptomyces asiaticus]|uniref:MBL fold metallo-hydrolase n=1 Tax=Streptomyces asiaticus TaxID=114695 RepID=UPI001BA5A8C1|nr:MBL fold metallo-hydrolase [Streptomyces asiaticus]
MKLTHYGHACVLVELSVGDEIIRFLCDPGGYSRDFEHEADIDAVFITHAHADHVDGERLGRLLADNPSAELVLNAHTQTALARLWDIAPGRMRVVGSREHVRPSRCQGRGRRR